MSARTEKRRQGGISRERLTLALIAVAVIVGLTVLGLYLKGSLTLDNLLVELGFKEPAAVTISIDDIPAYSGEPYVILQDNQPDFALEDLTLEPFETYSDLDSLGRCGVAYANICLEIMPTEPRGDIGQVKPSGWQSAKYDCVDGKYLYNRCHLIGYQLAGENANKQNLITGTRYMNVTGMLPFENMVDDYVEETENHVLYRVTPVFDGDNLVASGVQMEAFSVEDEGEGVCFNVFVYNVQPGIVINYATGESWEE
ncbi:MAG: DNA/RNA non-specific endonuclease [Clostridiales bacterium]|nr:DNA/RNA non-specific endonuclease [Clostridiales bacterium]